MQWKWAGDFDFDGRGKSKEIGRDADQSRSPTFPVRDWCRRQAAEACRTSELKRAVKTGRRRVLPES